jgi:flagellar hook-associated protein 1 FlgK
VSLFAVLGIGRSSLLTQQRAIQVTSNNVANVNTPGYTRQRAVLQPVSPTFLADGIPIGGGVEATAVERIIDEAIDEQLRQERSASGFDTTREATLARIEGIFEELGGTGIGAALTRLFESFSDLAAHPADPTARQEVIQAASDLVQLVHDADRRLTDMQVDANQQIEQSVREINEIARDIADLNREIFARENASAGVASALRDERSRLLEQLAEKIDFTSFERPDGQIAVFVGGGFLLVDSEVSATLEVRTGAPGNPSFFDIYHNLDGSIAGPITTRIASGELAAAIDARDTTVPTYRDHLDSLAYTLASRVNALHYPAAPDTAYGLIDDVQRRFFVDASQAAVPEGADFAQVAGAAANLSIHVDLLAEPRHIAAGRTSLGAGLGAAEGDGENARALADLAVLRSPVYLPGDAAGTPTGASASLGGFFDGVAGRLGAELSSTRRSLQQEELIIAQLEDRRGAISGVSLDEETANLIRFERAYQAAARIIQAADDMLEELLNL